jgi:DNA repair exonuclease SbcCD nuclease subunit
MKAVLFSDLHCHTWGDYSTIVEYRKEKMNSRLVDCVRVIDAIAKYVEAHNIRYGFFAGDLFHRKRLIDVSVFNVTTRAICRLAAKLEMLFLLVGNHDLLRRSSGGVFSNEHALDSLGRNKHIEIVDEPRIVLDTVGMVPYADDLETTKRGLGAIDGAKLGVLHVGISGAHTGAIEFRPLEPLTTDDLPNIPIYSGHYHRPQQVERKGKPITYIGAPLEFVRGDGHSKKRGFAVIDLDNPKFFERVTYKGPRFVSMNASDAKMSNDDVRGNFVDVVLDAPNVTAENMVAMLMEHGARAVNPIPYQIFKTKEARIKLKRTKKGLPSIHELCDAYVRQASEELDRGVLRRIAKEALHEVEASSK